ncbi:MAG: hypothetical protein Kow0090_01900 [Myxococcota bacterium]
MKETETTIKNIKDTIDNYEQTIHAMVGFINLFRYDDKTERMKEGVIVFQGRKLTPSNSNNDVTPDIGVLLPSNKGVLAEVKKSFPKNQNYWTDDFKQLKSYDDDLIGWPSSDEKVSTHDIVLLLYQDIGVPVKKFYEGNLDKFQFRRKFIMIEFNRDNQRQTFYFFRKLLGTLSEETLDRRLENGVKIRMDVFESVTEYSKIKIYDSEPPLPYLIMLIWIHIVAPKALEDFHSKKLRKNSKREIELEINDIIEKLHKGFSFYPIFQNTKRQQRIPHKNWVMNACDKLVELKEAVWVDSLKERIKISFKPYDDVLEHFIENCVKKTNTDLQSDLFS